MTLPSFISLQAFDSDVLTRPVWRLEDPDRASEAVALAQDKGVALMSFRGHKDWGAALVAHGFQPVEMLVTYEGPMPQGAFPAVRPAKPEESDVIADIARDAFSTTRWHLDPQIEDRKADLFKALWAMNNAKGRADLTLVAEQDGQIAGFNQVFVRGQTAIIDLIAVSPQRQRSGLGRQLVSASAQSGCTRLRVGTQSVNTGSCHLYEAMGLQAVSEQTTWHWHPA